MTEASAIGAAVAEALAAERADMPLIWIDPAGKGYPCQERPMTAKEARGAIAMLEAEVAQAVAAERERCARIAEAGLQLTHDGFELTGFERTNGTKRAIAREIRAIAAGRGEQ